MSWNARNYAHHARFVAELGSDVLGWLDAKPHERILDLGCGDGALTVHIEKSGAQVVGIDSAPELIAAAQSLALDARLMDATQLDFTEEFDAVFSNAALHWMQPADAVLAGVERALKPGGRFAGEMGGHGNIAAIRVALLAVLQPHNLSQTILNTWYFPSAQEYQQKLEQHGFRVDKIELFSRPTALPSDMQGWLDTFAKDFFHPLNAAQQATARQHIIALLQPILCDTKGRWQADYVRLRFLAFKPNG